MQFAKNEYTTQALIEELKSKYKKKITGQDFTFSDIAQYLRRGMIPYRYGGQKIEATKVSGVRVIRILQDKKKK